MLILILIDVQYSQNAVFSSEKGSNNQNHSSGFHHLVKKFPLFDTHMVRETLYVLSEKEQ